MNIVYEIELYDGNGKLLAKFENPTKTTIKGPITIESDKFIENNKVTLQCIATNVVLEELKEAIVKSLGMKEIIEPIDEKTL